MNPSTPKSFLGRALALLWLLTCVGLLVFAFVQRDEASLVVPFTRLLIALTFPVGLPVDVKVGILMQQACSKSGLPYSSFPASCGDFRVAPTQVVEAKRGLALLTPPGAVHESNAIHPPPCHRR